MLQENLISEILSSFCTSKSIHYAPLMGGLSSASLYRFEYNQQHYVLRLLPAHLDQNTRAHHITMTRLAGSIGAGPCVHFVDGGARAIIMDFVCAKSLKYIDLQDPHNIRECAALIARLHQSPMQFPIARSPFARFFEFLEKAQQHKSVYLRQLNSIKDLMLEVEKIFGTRGIALVPCHLDLHPLNILMTDEQPFFVDWVNGGMSNPYFDLATFAQFHCLAEQATTLFLTHYFCRSPTEFEQQCFTLAKPIRLFVIAAAYLCTVVKKDPHSDNAQKIPASFHDFIQQQLAGTLDVSYEQIGLIMLDTGMELIQEQELKDSLATLKHSTA